MSSSNSEDSDSDSGTNFKRGKRKPNKAESPVKKAIVKSPEVGSVDRLRKDEANGGKDYRRKEVQKTDYDADRKHQSGHHPKHQDKPKPRESHEVKRNRSKSSERRKVEDVKKKRSRSKEKSSQRVVSPPSYRRDQDTAKKRYSRERQDNIQKPRSLSRSRHQHRHHSPARLVITEISTRDYSQPNVNSKDDKKNRSSSSSKHSRQSSYDNAAFSYGPALPPAPKKSDDYMPALPRNEKRPSHSPVKLRSKIGPTLPKDFIPMEQSAIENYDMITSDDDDMTIGPLPGSQMTERDLELEKRKIELKLQQLDRRTEAVINPDIKHREEWMLELPEIRKVPDMGLSSRQFRKNDRPDFSDRTDWTKTPNDGHKPQRHPKEKLKTDDDKKRELEMKRRDHEQEKMAKEHKKSHKRDKTLLQIHEKKLKKEKVKL